jgi:hypothetical protein
MVGPVGLEQERPLVSTQPGAVSITPEAGSSDMDRAMLLNHLATVERHIASGEQHLRRQRQHVLSLQRREPVQERSSGLSLCWTPWSANSATTSQNATDCAKNWTGNPKISPAGLYAAEQKKAPDRGGRGSPRYRSLVSGM